jgi:hypothetical protein
LTLIKDKFSGAWILLPFFVLLNPSFTSTEKAWEQPLSPS